MGVSSVAVTQVSPGSLLQGYEADSAVIHDAVKFAAAVRLSDHCLFHISGGLWAVV